MAGLPCCWSLIPKLMTTGRFISASSRPEGPLRTRDNALSTKTVSYTFETVPKPTPERLAALRRVAEMPDDRIDFSDIPEWTDEQFARALRPDQYRPVKRQMTARLDADVIAWLKAPGKGYQTRMNAILRKAMLAALKPRE
jgi:uncharacterized protein (DUF4415 family)